MENSVSSVSASGAPVKTIELLDPRTRTVRKFTNTPEAVDKYVKEAREAEKELIKDSSFTAAAVGGAGLCAQLLYDGIKRGKFFLGKAAATGIFMGIISFAATALLDYKTKICKLADNFMKESEKRFIHSDLEGEKFPEYLNRTAEESDKIHEAKKEAEAAQQKEEPAEPQNAENIATEPKNEAEKAQNPKE